jgi:tetratricopeptide (TPR) repeat protein
MPADEAARTFERGLNLVEGLPFEDDLRGQLNEGLAQARRVRLARGVHALADQTRELHCSQSIPAARLRQVTTQCDELWDRRSTLLGSARAADDSELRADLRDIAVFAAAVKFRLSEDRSSDRSASDRLEAVRLLDEAEAIFGPSAVLERERHAHGLTPARPAAAARTAWEHLALGRSMLARGELDDAGRELAAAVELDPAGRWANFYYGLWAHRVGRYEDAVAAFSVCVGGGPDIAGCYYNRALALAALGRTRQALNDYDRVLQLDPTHAAAALNRGALYLQEGRHEQAMADFRRALELGADGASVHYNLALANLALRDPDAAIAEARLALKQNAGHQMAGRLVESLEQRR